MKFDHTERFPAHDFLQGGFTCQTSRTNNQGDTGTFKVCYVGYFGIPCLHTCRRHISVIHITYEDIQSSSYENQPVEKGR